MTELGQITPHSTNVLFPSVEFDAQLEEIGTRRTDAANALGNAIEILIREGFTTEGATFHVGYSVHGFLPRFVVHNRIVHIELNPNSQRFGIAKVRLTEEDGEKLQEIRETGLISTGAENAAITRYILPDEDHRKQASDYLILLTGEAITSLLKQVFEQLDIADDNQQVNKARGFKRIKNYSPVDKKTF